LIWFGLSFTLWRVEAVAQELVVNLRLNTSDFRFETQDGYDVIRTDDSRFTSTCEPGKLQLPVFVPTYIILYYLKLQFGIPLEDEGLVSLKLYDPSGRLARTLFSENKTAGYYDLSWESDVPAGLYFLWMSTANEALTSKIILRW